MTFRREAAFAAAIFSESFPEAALDASALWRFNRSDSSLASFWMVGTWVCQRDLLQGTAPRMAPYFLQNREAFRIDCVCKLKRERGKFENTINLTEAHSCKLIVEA